MADDIVMYVFWSVTELILLACENARFSSLFAAWDVSFHFETSQAANSEEKRMFLQAMDWVCLCL